MVLLGWVFGFIPGYLAPPAMIVILLLEIKYPTYFKTRKRNVNTEEFKWGEVESGFLKVPRIIGLVILTPVLIGLVIWGFIDFINGG